MMDDFKSLKRVYKGNKLDHYLLRKEGRVITRHCSAIKSLKAERCTRGKTSNGFKHLLMFNPIEKDSDVGLNP